MSRFAFWLIGTFGIGTVLLGGAILILGWPVVVQFFVGTRIGRALAAVGAGAIGIMLIYEKGRSVGTAAQVARAQAQSNKEVNDALATGKRIDAQPDAAIDQQLRDKWGRPDE